MIPPGLSVLTLVGLILCVQAIVWYEPEQVHITVGEKPDQMIVVWSTFSDTKSSQVLYGKGIQPKFTLNATGTTTKFIDGGSERRTQYIHRVVLEGLEPQSQYSYVVGSNKGWSDLFTFTTWPAGNKWSPRVALYGDLGNENPQSLPRLQVEAIQGMYDAIFHIGDFAYNMYTDNARVGDSFMRQIEPLASRLPYMTCPGNHEENYNFSNYRNRFWMPGDENKQMFYSFVMGPVRVISIATELFYFPNYGLLPIVEQYLWLEKTLAEANKPENRAKQPWIITFGHRPMYCTNADNNDCTHHETLIRVGIPVLHLLGFEDLFMKYGVDLALWAHEHSYERLWPVYNRQVMNASTEFPYTNPRAPVHITTGSAGCGAGHDKFANTTQPWSAFRILDYGYTRMHVLNSTHLYLEQVSDDKDGQIIDKMTLIQHNHGSFDSNPKPVKPVADPLKKMWKTWEKHVRQYLHK